MKRREPMTNESAEKRFGRNVKLRAIFKRHGEKEFRVKSDPNASLTPDGQAQSEAFGQKITTKTIKTYASNTGRTQETGELVAQGAEADRKLRQMTKDDLGLEYDPKGEFTQEVMRLKKEMLGDDFDNLSPEDKEKLILAYETHLSDYYLSFGDQVPPGVKHSPEQVADRILRRVKLYIKMAGRLPNNYEATLVNVTHDFCLAAFFKKVIGFDSVADIGGPVDYNEEFEVLIKTNDQGNKEFKMTFRNKEYSLDEFIN